MPRLYLSLFLGFLSLAIFLLVISSQGGDAMAKRGTFVREGRPQNSGAAKWKSRSVCGNGKVEAGEECDDGNTTSGDGCSRKCTIEGGAGGGTCGGDGA